MILSRDATDGDNEQLRWENLVVWLLERAARDGSRTRGERMLARAASIIVGRLRLLGGPHIDRVDDMTLAADGIETALRASSALGELLKWGATT